MSRFPLLRRRKDPDPFGYLPESSRQREPRERGHEDYTEWRARLLEQYGIPNTLHLEQLRPPWEGDQRSGAHWAEEETPPLGVEPGVDTTGMTSPGVGPDEGPPTTETPVVPPPSGPPSSSSASQRNAKGAGEDDLPEPSSLPVHQRMAGFWGAPQFLASHERMVVCVRPTGLALAERLVHPVLTLAAAILFLWLSGVSELGWLSLVGLLLLVYSAFLAIYRVSKWITEYWVITPRRLLRVNGLVRRSSTTVNLTQLTAVSYRESVVQRMSKEGEVELHGRDVPEDMRIIRSLPKPKWLHDVLQALADPDERKRVSDVLPPVDEGALLRPGLPLETGATIARPDRSAP